MITLGLLQLGLLAPVLFGALAAALISATYPFIRRALARAEPAHRAGVITALCALPAVAAVGLTALCFLPSVLGNLWPALDHCPEHAGGHPHLCWIHVPVSSGDPLGWLVVAAALGVLLIRLSSHVVRLFRSRRILDALARTAMLDRARRVWRIDTPEPLAMSAGVLVQRTFVSRGLLDALAPDLVEAALVHERVHQRRRDTLVKLVASTLSLLHLPSTRRSMLRDLELAVEQACDEETAVHIGDRLRVAQALLALERLLQQTRGQSLGPMGVSFGGPSLVPRVESLLAPPIVATTRDRVWRWLLPIAAAGAVLAATEPIHHVTEMLLGLFAG